MNDLFSVIQTYSPSINDGRTLKTVFNHMISETVELAEEIDNGGTGSDGIMGEAIDVIACALDIIYLDNPNITNEELIKYLEKKCIKWKMKYST